MLPVDDLLFASFIFKSHNGTEIVFVFSLESRGVVLRDGEGKEIIPKSLAFGIFPRVGVVDNPGSGSLPACQKTVP